MRMFAETVWTLTLWAAAIIVGLHAETHNGLTLLALIFWLAGLALAVRRWTRSSGAEQVDPTT